MRWRRSALRAIGPLDYRWPPIHIPNLSPRRQTATSEISEKWGKSLPKDKRIPRTSEQLIRSRRRDSREIAVFEWQHVAHKSTNTPTKYKCDH